MKSVSKAWIEEESPSPFVYEEGLVDGGIAKADEKGIPLPYRPEGKIHLRYPKELKLHVTLEALRERSPQCEIGAMYGIPQSLISIWKKSAIEAIKGNIHYKQRNVRSSRELSDDSATTDDSSEALETEADAVSELCRLLRSAARQIERDPASFGQLVKNMPKE